MEPWTIWIIAAILLLIIEVLTQMMWAMCLTIGAIGALVCSIFGVEPQWQLLAMAAIAIVAYAALLPWVKRRQERHSERWTRTGMDALPGRRATVTQDICPGHLGRVRIDGDSWQARPPGTGTVIPAGTEVTVTSYDSIILTVEPTSTPNF